MFDSLSDRLNGTLDGLRGKGKLSEDDINKAMREIRLALLEADVNFAVVRDFVAKVKERAMGAEVLDSLTPGQQVVKIVHEELTSLMGTSGAKLSFANKPPTVILLAGLQGSGKTTAAGKLARLLAKQKKTPALVAADVYRPAAIQQLQTLGKSLQVPVFERGTADPVETAAWGIEQAKAQGRDVVIVDTAGRLSIDQEMMDELVRIKQKVKPHDVVLVLDSMTGQDAVATAEAFREAVDYDGVILTKLDGDARGGAALAVRAVTGKPILYTSVGEKLDQLEEFHPERMASRILGMGDVMSLIERAQEEFDENQAAEMEAKLRQGRVHARGLPRPAADGAQDDPRPGHGRPAGDAAGRRPPAQEHEGRRAAGRPGRGDHPVDDAVRAAQPEADRRQPPPPDRRGVGHQRPDRQPAARPVQADAEDDEAGRQGQDAPVPGHAAPLSGRPG